MIDLKVKNLLFIKKKLLEWHWRLILQELSEMQGLSSLEMNTAIRVQILDEVVYISHNLIHSGKVSIQLFSFQLWGNS